MTMQRRRFVVGTVAAATGSMASALRAQSGWATRPVRVVVPYPAGGGIDLIARLILEKVQGRWPHGALVDNKVGGNSVIGAEYVLRQPKDGTTLLLTNSTTFTLPYVMDKPGFQPLRDFVAVTEVIVDQLVVYVRSDSKSQTLRQLVDQEKRTRGLVNFGSYGVGTNPHLLLVEMNRQLGLAMAHIPYKGAGELARAVVAGEVHVGTAPYAAVRGFIETGRVKPVAVFGAHRLSLLPDVPTLLESGVSNFESTQWTGLFAPRGTPEPTVAQIAEDFQSLLRTPDFRSQLAERGTVPGRRTGADFQRVVERDAEVLGKMNVAAGIRMD